MSDQYANLFVELEFELPCFTDCQLYIQSGYWKEWSETGQAGTISSGNL